MVTTTPAPKKITDSDLEPEIYTQFGRLPLKWIGISILLFLLGLFLNFSLGSKIENYIESQLRAQFPCPVQYKSLGTSLFFPKVDLVGVEVPAGCFSENSAPMTFEFIQAALVLPSLAPPGLKFEVTASLQKQILKAVGVVSPFGHRIRIPEQLINLESLPIVQEFMKVKGSIKVDALLSLDNKQMMEGPLSLESKNMEILPQNVQGFELPALPIGKVELKALMGKKNQMTIQALRLGDPKNADSPLELFIKGDVRVNAQNFAESPVELAGDLKLSPALIDKLPVLNLLLGSMKKDENGTYKLKMRGTFGAPKFQ